MFVVQKTLLLGDTVGQRTEPSPSTAPQEAVW